MVFHMRNTREKYFCSMTRFPFSNIWGCPQPTHAAVSFSMQAAEQPLLSSLNGVDSYQLIFYSVRNAKGAKSPLCILNLCLCTLFWISVKFWVFPKLRDSTTSLGNLLQFHDPHRDKKFSNILKIVICIFFLSYISKKSSNINRNNYRHVHLHIIWKVSQKIFIWK